MGPTGTRETFKKSIALLPEHLQKGSGIGLDPLSLGPRVEDLSREFGDGGIGHAAGYATARSRPARLAW